MEIRLLVIRSENPKQIADFYSLLNLKFDYHKHGNSPMHYSAQIGTLILEIYPLSKNQIEVDKTLRLGFAIENFENVLDELRTNNIKMTEPTLTEFGYVTILTDPEGRKVELYKK
jgi:hypothetical protein